MLVRHYLNMINNNILIIVPTTSLVEVQLYKDFKDYGYDVENNVSRKYHGYDIDENKKELLSLL